MYYDSMLGVVNGQLYLTALVSFMDYMYRVGQDEKIDWIMINDGQCPQQSNCNDCGVHMLANIINTTVHGLVMPTDEWCVFEATYYRKFLLICIGRKLILH